MSETVVSDYLDAVGPYPAEVPKLTGEVYGWIAHYPRPRLPGRCMAVMAAFHNLRDPHLVEDIGRPLPKSGGLLVVVRQVWQTEGPEPRMIEASIEWTTEFGTSAPREVEDPLVEKLTFDHARMGQDRMWPGSQRAGMLWADRSFGVGPAKPYFARYDAHGWVEGDEPSGFRAFVRRF